MRIKKHGKHYRTSSRISTNSLRDEFLPNLPGCYRMVQHSTRATACRCETWIPFSHIANIAYGSWVTGAQTVLTESSPALLGPVRVQDRMNQQSWCLAISHSSTISMDCSPPDYTSLT